MSVAFSDGCRCVSPVLPARRCPIARGVHGGKDIGRVDRVAAGDTQYGIGQAYLDRVHPGDPGHFLAYRPYTVLARHAGNGVFGSDHPPTVFPGLVRRAGTLSQLVRLLGSRFAVLSNTVLSVVPRPVIVRAPAKVNLYLGVGDLRDDGYHEVTTVCQALSLSDRVEVAPARALSVRVRGDKGRDVALDRDNVVWQAVSLLARHAEREPLIDIAIDKAIPVAGGMAGSSADAAATLVGLNALWRLDLDRAELADIAAELGSDVPFALYGGTAIGTGRGEQLLTVLSRNDFHWVVAIATGGLATSAVYSELDRLRSTGRAPGLGDPQRLMQALAAGNPKEVAVLLGNDLQAAALSLRPDLRRTLRAGVEAGALAGIVSGSGPTCVFLCADADSAVSTAAELSGGGVCRSVRVATGPVAGARVESEQY
jgi:4-diphosphocytidyl-2-C-methyl-D-erythritol kinase